VLEGGRDFACGTSRCFDIPEFYPEIDKISRSDKANSEARASEGWIPAPIAAPVGLTTPFSNLQTFGFRAKLRGRLRDRLGNCSRRKSPFSLSAGPFLSIAWDFADFFPSFRRLFINGIFEMLAL